MPADFAGETTQGDVLRGILLSYLLSSRVSDWPGVDGFTDDDLLDHYPSASANGEVPAYADLCRRHAELHSEIQSFFTRKGWCKH
jgi:hypothetical protein